MSNLVKELKSTVADLDSFAGYVSETEGEEDRSGIDNIVKYKEPKWFHNGVDLPPDDEYIDTGTDRFVIKWHPDKSLAPDRIPVPDGEKFPDLKKRNEETAREELVLDVNGKTLKGP